MKRLALAYGRREPRDEVSQRLAYASFVSLKHRLLFVETPKADSTTMKWILAGLAGQKPRPILSGDETSLAMCIHDRQLLIRSRR
jgi:hypothetical protein